LRASWNANGRRPSIFVLVVDDDPFLREILALGLLSHGFEIRTAANGPDAVAICQSGETIDVALVDDQMPGMDGPQTIAALRAELPQVRCALMSADIERCLARDVGTKTLVAKPFGFEDVARVLRRLAEQPMGVPD
jgi:CheY-like chemotaxis protein